MWRLKVGRLEARDLLERPSRTAVRRGIAAEMFSETSPEREVTATQTDTVMV